MKSTHGIKMDESIIKKYMELLEEIEENLKKHNFRACRRLNTDLIRLSWYFNFQEGIFLSECIGSILHDLYDLNSEYELDKKDIEEVVEKISDLLKTIIKTLPEAEKKITQLYKSIRDVRVFVTNLQFKYSRYGKRRPFFEREIRIV